jgi:hypothetical protein
MMDVLGLDAWWDDPAYKAAQGIPDPMDITKFEWETILRFMGANDEEIRDVQVRMGRVWR